MAESETFAAIVASVPFDFYDAPSEWVRHVLHESYDRRMHGGILHGLIVDHLAGLIDKDKDEARTILAMHAGDWSGVEEADEVTRLRARVAELEAALDNAVVYEIAAERFRQFAEEGWTPEHDDGEDCGELARAAAATTPSASA